MEWLRWSQSLCGGCNQPRDESFSPDGPTYKVEAIRCRSCEARDAAGAKWRDAKGNSTHGLFFAVTPDDEGGDDE